jgi:hypothetical protein
MEPTVGWMLVALFASLGALLLFLGRRVKVPPYDPNSIPWVWYRHWRLMLIIGGIGGLVAAVRLSILLLTVH